MFYIKLCYCFYIRLCSQLLRMIPVSYRFMVFPVEFKVHVALYFHEVIGDRELVIIQQFTFASILHLVGLASASLMEAFHKTVKRFVDCEVLEAVSH